jgi:predicted acyltransferase
MTKIASPRARSAKFMSLEAGVTCALQLGWKGIMPFEVNLWTDVFKWKEGDGS